MAQQQFQERAAVILGGLRQAAQLGEDLWGLDHMSDMWKEFELDYFDTVTDVAARNYVKILDTTTTLIRNEKLDAQIEYSLRRDLLINIGDLRGDRIRAMISGLHFPVLSS